MGPLQQVSCAGIITRLPPNSESDSLPLPDSKSLVRLARLGPTGGAVLTLRNRDVLCLNWFAEISCGAPLVRIFVILLSVFLASEDSAMTLQQHAVPTDRSTLKSGVWFPYVISKLAPLEWWSYQESISDVKREEYRSDWSYQLARQNTWEFPRFCFSMFRPSEESFRALLNAVKDYEGAVAWVMHDDCIGAFKAKPTGQGLVRLPYSMSEQEIEKHNQSLQQPPERPLWKTQ